MLRRQFLCYVLKAIFFIKIAPKLSYICKKMPNFWALGAPPPDPRASCGWKLCSQAPKTAPIANFWLHAWTWLVSETNQLLYYFSITIHKFTSTSPAFTHKTRFKKLAMENADWSSRWTSVEGAWAPWPNMNFYNWLLSWQNKNLYKEKSSSGFLFSAKMLLETMHLTCPYLDQSTYN